MHSQALMHTPISWQGQYLWLLSCRADMRAACSGGSSAKTQVHQVAKDISGHGNDLPLVRPPGRHDLVVDKVRH